MALNIVLWIAGIFTLSSVAAAGYMLIKMAYLIFHGPRTIYDHRETNFKGAL